MKYCQEVKVELVNRYQSGELIADICLETGVARSTFYTWLEPYKTMYAQSGAEVTPSGFNKMKKHVDKLEQMIRVLQTVNCTVSSPLKEKLAELELLQGQYSVHVLCDALCVSRGTFYNHIYRNKRNNSIHQIRRDQLSERIKVIYDNSNQIYGAKKVREVLATQGEFTSEKLVAQLMNEMNLHSIRTGAKKMYEQFRKEGRTDSLKMNFSTSHPNQVWVSDVTYFLLNKKKYYICTILDLFSRKVLACKISTKHSTQLITSTFKAAYTNRNPKEGLIFHSDQGAQYTSHRFQTLLKNLHIVQSFSPTGKPHHNAVMESFFSSMKREELYRTNYHSENEFRKSVDRYVLMYNNERPHTTLRFKTPTAYESLHYQKSEKTAD